MAARRLRFPGLYCPGLIEAVTFLKNFLMKAAGFRGSIAPASLKRYQARDYHPAGSQGFRGSIAPASLKQAHVRRHAPDYMARFRGSIAPASLKRTTEQRNQEGLQRFRGSIAPASLKPPHRGDEPPQRAPFPGLYCPGLIEAKLAAVAGAEVAAGFRGSIAPASLKRSRC